METAYFLDKSVSDFCTMNLNFALHIKNKAYLTVILPCWLYLHGSGKKCMIFPMQSLNPAVYTGYAQAYNQYTSYTSYCQQEITVLLSPGYTSALTISPTETAAVPHRSLCGALN